MIPSPCINICQMDPASGLCRGCFRTIDEIASWVRLTDDGQLKVLAAVARRRIDQAAQTVPEHSAKSD